MQSNLVKLAKPYLSGEGRLNLEDYSRMDDRTPPPIFVGREGLIRRIGEDAARCRANARDDACFTIVVNGAQGSGKTSLLSEIERRFHDPSGVVKVLKVPSFVLSNPVKLATQLIRTYGGNVGDPRQEKTTSTSLKASVAGSGAERRSTVTEQSIAQQIQMTHDVWSTVIHNTAPEDRAGTVMLLLIDEAQNISGLEPSRTGTNPVVSALHSGFMATDGLKIVPVFAGLLDTLGALKQRGVSRVPSESVHRIGSLTHDETLDLIQRWMRYEGFEFEGMFSQNDIEITSSKIAVASEGWPRHVYGYLRALSRGILQAVDSGQRQINLDDVLDAGHEERAEYYKSRLQAAELDDCESVIQDCAKTSHDGFISHDDLLERAKDAGISAKNFRKLNRRAIHAGILEPVKRQGKPCVKFPIPSFQTYFRQGFDHERFKEVMREQIETLDAGQDVIRREDRGR